MHRRTNNDNDRHNAGPLVDVTPASQKFREAGPFPRIPRWRERAQPGSLPKPLHARSDLSEARTLGSQPGGVVSNARRARSSTSPGFELHPSLNLLHVGRQLAAKETEVGLACIGPARGEVAAHLLVDLAEVDPGQRPRASVAIEQARDHRPDVINGLPFGDPSGGGLAGDGPKKGDFGNAQTVRMAVHFQNV